MMTTEMIKKLDLDIPETFSMGDKEWKVEVRKGEDCRFYVNHYINCRENKVEIRKEKAVEGFVDCIAAIALDAMQKKLKLREWWDECVFEWDYDTLSTHIPELIFEFLTTKQGKIELW